MCPEDKGLNSRALFVVDERGIIRWSRAYPGPVNPGVDGILCALGFMKTFEEATLRRADREGNA